MITLKGRLVSIAFMPGEDAFGIMYLRADDGALQGFYALPPEQTFGAWTWRMEERNGRFRSTGDLAAFVESHSLIDLEAYGEEGEKPAQSIVLIGSKSIAQELRNTSVADQVAAFNAKLAEREKNYVGDPSRSSDGIPNHVTNAPDPPEAGDMSLGQAQAEWAAIDKAKLDAERKR